VAILGAALDPYVFGRAEDGIRDFHVTGVQTCALPICDAHASAIRTLHRKAPGRLFCGLGSGAYSINRDWFGVEADRPVARMVDLAGAVRAWLHAENGQRVRYEGPYYRVNARVQAPVLGRLDVPLLFAGFNRRMVAAA